MIVIEWKLVTHQRRDKYVASFLINATMGFFLEPAFPLAFGCAVAPSPITTTRTYVGTGVSEIASHGIFSAGGNPNNPYIFGKLTSRRSDLAMFNRAKSFSSAVICSLLKGPYQGVPDLGENSFTTLAKNWKKCV